MIVTLKIEITGDTEAAYLAYQKNVLGHLGALTGGREIAPHDLNEGFAAGVKADLVSFADQVLVGDRDKAQAEITVTPV